MANKFQPWKPPNPDFWTIDQIIERYKSSLAINPIWDDKAKFTAGLIDSAYFYDLYIPMQNTWDMTYVRPCDMGLAWDLLWVEFIVGFSVRLGDLVINQLRPKERGELRGIDRRKQDGLITFALWYGGNKIPYYSPLRSDYYHGELVKIFPKKGEQLVLFV